MGSSALRSGLLLQAHGPHKHSTVARFTEEASARSMGEERIRSHVPGLLTSPTIYMMGDAVGGAGGQQEARPWRSKTASSDTLGFSDFTGAISWGTATPMDVVKSRIQADGVYLNKYRGVLDCISQSYRQEGFKVSYMLTWVSSSLAEGSGGEAGGGDWESRCWRLPACPWLSLVLSISCFIRQLWMRLFFLPPDFFVSKFIISR